MSVVIVDCKVGNLNSVRRTLARLRVDCVVSSDPAEIAKADRIVLPGVGHFETAMNNLRNLGLVEALNQVALECRRPVLGICLGMQLMAARSEEGRGMGLAWFDAEVVKFQVKDTLRHKVPHVGWNEVTVTRECDITRGMPGETSFYFLHSYHVRPVNGHEVVCETEYEYRFPSAIQRDNLFGVQFHPEKSHDAGEALLRNFLEL